MPSMSSSQSVLTRVAFWLAGSAAVAVLFSIAACNILIALALVTLLFSGAELRVPPIRLPLALFMLGTVISLMLSVDPVSGRQIRKFFFILLVVLMFRTGRRPASGLSWAARRSRRRAGWCSLSRSIARRSSPTVF
jgi:hypothetical protein